MVQPYQPPPGYHIEHPNREKAASKATKGIVILVLLVSIALVLVVTIGGWSKLAGQKPANIAFVLIYLIFAIYVGRWNRGVLPMIAALAMILGIFAAISGPQWMDRHKSGFTDPSLPSDLLGLICFVIVPVQILLIAFAMRGFSQSWNVEVEVPDGQTYQPGMFSPGGQAQTV
jgi:protein-S-isoprenylcysteine O-methyltransferase Ste14